LSILDISPCVISPALISNNTLVYGSILFAEIIIGVEIKDEVMIGIYEVEVHVTHRKKTSTFC
jgi:hypothetical protein